MVADVVEETRRRLDETRPETVDDVRKAGRPLVAFSDAMADTDRTLKAFMRERLFRHPHIEAETGKARIVVADLFRVLSSRPDQLPAAWWDRADGASEGRTARIVADYIAGMTDRYAVSQHARLCNGEPGSR